ncbi:hypothetical protein [Bacillus solimangrovi]|uniref:Sublancin immunity protein SunI-like PH domain-containing protein n=1 Tax=Bacillus solimangrovi TaxID=1305675 RepID=A0A1E5LHN9_9BACI|nr:hypothetical protein [Bacillus solimangrovi]OEH93581.1 hypothetical protein BFG57_00930 [Bacillus solimangrovi]
MSVKVKDNGDRITISWLVSKFNIDKKEITNVYEGSEYAGDASISVHIGHPYANTDRIIIETTSDNYLIYTSNGDGILELLQEG